MINKERMARTKIVKEIMLTTLILRSIDDDGQTS